jgi:MoaA/NifB/PqqE/SkfB family radical SAM enzyme
MGEVMYNPPMVVAWEFTNKCNLNCIHCASECCIDSNKNELTTEEALDLCHQMASLGAKSLALSGGEPLLRPDWMTIANRLNHFVQFLHLSSSVGG